MKSFNAGAQDCLRSALQGMGPDDDDGGTGEGNFVYGFGAGVECLDVFPGPEHVKVLYGLVKREDGLNEV